jgi:hypothetical protein
MQNPNFQNNLAEAHNVIGSYHIGGRLWLLVIERELCPVSPFVLCLYMSEEDSWVSGNYFSNKKDAFQRFIQKISLGEQI